MGPLRELVPVRRTPLQVPRQEAASHEPVPDRPRGHHECEQSRARFQLDAAANPARGWAGCRFGPAGAHGRSAPSRDLVDGSAPRARCTPKARPNGADPHSPRRSAMRVSSSIRRPSSNRPARRMRSRVTRARTNAVAPRGPPASPPGGSRSRGTPSPWLPPSRDSPPRRCSPPLRGRRGARRLCSGSNPEERCMSPSRNAMISPCGDPHPEVACTARHQPDRGFDHVDPRKALPNQLAGPVTA